MRHIIFTSLIAFLCACAESGQSTPPEPPGTSPEEEKIDEVEIDQRGSGRVTVGGEAEDRADEDRDSRIDEDRTSPTSEPG